MLKLAGAVLIMAASLLAGMSAAEHVQDEYEAMRHIRGVLYALRSEILYSRSCLGEAFGKIAGEVGAPFDQWLSGMAEQMQERDGIPFSVIWKNGMSVISAGSRLPGRKKNGWKCWEWSLAVLIWRRRSAVWIFIWKSFGCLWKKKGKG